MGDRYDIICIVFRVNIIIGVGIIVGIIVFVRFIRLL